jgi:hypothetical protein
LSTSSTKHRIWNLLQKNGMSRTYRELEAGFGPPIMAEWKLQVNEKFLTDIHTTN